MAMFQYRAVTAGGVMTSGQLDAPSQREALTKLRGQGVAPLEIKAARGAATESSGARVREPNAKGRAAITKAIGELAVLLGAGLSLDRALALTIENIEHKPTRAEIGLLLGDVREGMSLARAMAARPGQFPPMAQAMVEAGEANGQLPQALHRLADTRERSEALRQLVGTSMIYPTMLVLLAVGVILMMLLFVVPQFETAFAGAPGQLPAATVAVMGASRFLRDYGWFVLGGVVACGFLVRAALRQPGVRATTDRLLMRVPQIGPLIVNAQTAQFARTLSVLVEGGVALPQAMAMAQRSLTNAYLAEAVGKVAASMKEGGGLSGPLAAAGVFPRLVLGFFRTGEETSQLGLMLGRLADVLDADVRLRIQRVIAWAVPLITIVLGAAVAGIIAAVMTAILGFNDLATGT
jgi:general secretion pathway protein F